MIDPVELEAAPKSLAEDHVAIWALGQAGFIAQDRAKTVVFDPYLSDSIKHDALGPRQFPPPIDPSALRRVDVVFISHDHGDHLDPETLRPLLTASPECHFVAPGRSRDLLIEMGVRAEQVIVPALELEQLIGDVEIQAIPSAHYEWETDEEGLPRFYGYVVGLGEVTIYHSGDSILYDGMIERLRRQRIDVAILPINGRDWPREQAGLVGNLDAAEALYLADAIGAGLLIPCHYDLFAGNSVNPAHFVDLLYRRYWHQRFKLMQPGERIICTGTNFVSPR
jgi:L-ascorbate 6-phosphate lactonase